MGNEPEPQVTATKPPAGWKIEMNDDTWELLTDAVAIAFSSVIREGDLTHK